MKQDPKNVGCPKALGIILVLIITLYNQLNSEKLRGLPRLEASLRLLTEVSPHGSSLSGVRMECDKAARSDYLGPSRMLRGNQSSFTWGLGSRGLEKGWKRQEQGQWAK